ncbi:MAG: tRNA (guanine(6)-N2)-methyltransferase, partial [Sulfolobales archaeon]
MSSGKRLRFFATTIPGIEDIAAEELSSLDASIRGYGRSKVFFEGYLEDIYRLNFSARTINKIFIELAHERFERLEDIYRVARGIEYTGILDPGRSFAVRCERLGEHSFTSIDVARVVGAAVIDSYLSSKGVRPRVDLENPDVLIEVFVRDDEVLIGVNTTGETLARRRYRVYNHPAALKTLLAAAMIRLSGYKGEPLLDPLCGGATIPIEAAHMARKIPTVLFRQDYLFRKLPLYDPLLEREIATKLIGEIRMDSYKITCLDISPQHLAGAYENARSAKVIDTIKFVLGDATRRESYKDIDAEVIVTNPPYGMRSHRLEKIDKFY